MWQRTHHTKNIATRNFRNDATQTKFKNQPPQSPRKSQRIFYGPISRQVPSIFAIRSLSNVRLAIDRSSDVSADCLVIIKFAVLEQSWARWILTHEWVFLRSKTNILQPKPFRTLSNSFIIHSTSISPANSPRTFIDFRQKYVLHPSTHYFIAPNCAH